MPEERISRGSEWNPYRGLRNGGLRKDWLKQSPCKGCLNLDFDDGTHYCSIVVNIDKFFDTYYGKEEGQPQTPHKFLNCQFKKYVK
jgi:hypothetical protein